MNNRKDFEDSFLSEMTQSLGNIDLFDELRYNIKERAKYSSIIDLESGYKKIEGTQTLYYWFEKDNNIVIAIELTKKPQTLIVNAVAKNPLFKNNPPYATDLYKKILNDNNSIRIMSDIYLSKGGIKIWKYLLDDGINISVYDNSKPGQSFKNINSINELQNYIRQDSDYYQKYQVVITSKNDILGEVVSNFNTRRLRELSGML